MSKLASAWYTEQWIQGVKHDYQSTGFLLQNTTMPPTRINGSKAHWFLAGRGTATKHDSGNKVQVMNASRRTVNKDLENYEAADYLFVKDVNRTNANERDTINETIAMAIGRQFDKFIIDEMAAQTFPADQVAGTFATAFSLATALQGIQKLQKKLRGWRGNVFCAIPSNPWNQLMSFDQFNSSDFVGMDLPFTKMTDTRFWNGVNWMLFPDEELPLALTDDRDFFMWHQSALGFAAADMDNLDGTVDWVAEMRGWLHQAWIDAEAKTLDLEGIINFKCDDDAAITVA